MKLAVFLPLIVFPLLCSCGDGGVSLDTDNVKGEYYPKGSRAALTLADEVTTATEPHSESVIEMTYVSYGNNQGSLSINGQAQEPATLSTEADRELTFTTPTAAIRLNLTATDAPNAAITEWTYTTLTEPTSRIGTNGVIETQVSK